MEALVKQMRDGDSNTVYPITKASAVYMPNGIDTVERVLIDSRDYSSVITFSGDQIKKTLASGGESLTEFRSNSIVETVKNAEGTIIETKTTTFNEDGSIKIEVV